MASDPRWDRLTSPAQAAWRWAWATALTRSGTDPSGAVVDPLDLLAGISLAHLQDSPVGWLFEHFEIPLGAVLGDGGARRYSPNALLSAEHAVPAGTLPPTDPPVEHVLDHALTEMPPSADGLVDLAMLFGALLETSNEASTALRRELTDRSVDPDPVLGSCREHLGQRSTYVEYLREHHPYRRPEVQLASLAPDEPPTRWAENEPADLVGLHAEVDAFAYLIASRTLTPPLAVGLFGDWGSGKSYFLRSVQRRIDRLVTATAEHPPFHRAIAQVEFNAWQYVEGNLWASLLEHLFRNLRRAGERDADDLLDARRREYLTQITAHTAEHQRALERRDELAGEQQAAQQAVEERAGERDRTLAELERARRRNSFRGWRPSAELQQKIRATTGLAEVGEQAAELQNALASTRETLTRAGPVLGALRTGGWRYALALVAVVALGPSISFLSGWLDVSAVSNAIASVSGLLAGLTVYATRGAALLSSTLGAVTDAQAKLNAELDVRREELDQEVRAAEVVVAETERALESAVAQEQRLAASVAELEAQLAQITPSSVLAEFVDKRVASDDYRRHLGVPALVRQDLERLSRLLTELHKDDSGIDEQHAIDRIVLYIDDLDRCPTHLVVKVLEAVHLLLAFPLFVVVVAVDARWLEASLAEHYSQLGADAAVPADYLEKIFQVPFWVRPLEPDVRRQMVRGLLAPNVTTPDVTTGEQDGRVGATDVPEVDLPAFVELVESFGVTDQAEQPWLEAARLTVTADELRLLEQITPLIGSTPRAVKRFVNVYLLLRAMGRGRGWALPDQGQVAVLLAIATGLPALADAMFPHLAAVTTLPAARDATTDGGVAAQRAQLDTWLTGHPEWQHVDLSGTSRWADLILRFRFHRSPRPIATVE
ncbi:MAG: P-loop NTPase fold protein [Pseudonocardia sp.]